MLAFRFSARRGPLALLLLTLLLGSCQSEKAVFRFQANTSNIASSPVSSAPEAAQEIEQAPAVASQTPLPARPIAQGPAPQQPPAKVRPLRHLLARVAAKSLQHPAAARPRAVAEKHPAERTLLWSGIGSAALGVLLTYLGGNTVPVSTSLLSVAQLFLWLGGLLLAAWFVLLLMRASKE